MHMLLASICVAPEKLLEFCKSKHMADPLLALFGVCCNGWLMMFVAWAAANLFRVVILQHHELTLACDMSSWLHALVFVTSSHGVS